ncbi:contractile injection system protein, VgrG/Pvc8 family [Salinicola tamaricis]|uniref:contractile injection system protein, VgrG/Pvc8 family n=1 Tax=Salinicola tamaricis TaxID=1771309 RepID=UPI002413F1C9|nr:contractile injection system protein, VgrG/Pvc8 family [Salinicola tamaricis]
MVAEFADEDDDYAGHRIVFTDDVDTTQPVSPQAIRFHRQAATEREDALTQWGGVRTQQPTRVSVGTFDYKQPSLTKRTGLDTLSDQGNLPPTELYDYAGEYYYHGYARGERLTENRLEAHESRAKRFRGSGGARQLQAGAGSSSPSTRCTTAAASPSVSSCCWASPSTPRTPCRSRPSSRRCRAACSPSSTRPRRRTVSRVIPQTPPASVCRIMRLAAPATFWSISKPSALASPTAIR